MKNFIFLLAIGVLLAQFSNVYSLKCRSGFGISQPGSEEVKYYYDNATPQLDCPGTINTNPANQPKGCYKNVYKLSGGNLYVQLGCFSESAILAASERYGRTVFTHVCTTDNCNSSQNLQMSLIAFSTLLFASTAKFFNY
ncbi:hypothetical protein BpHYR1_041317 [Brachionus plicatilis]|uniref:UPAR/Ly6 domain-containing protein n=1 Tax=Brachionus plicatilis TaxID=10195 RepID=A0A3M7Q3H8_BRAPC|nr:hypothetical protein BpHYR1_041317 [Brachionus plicatilis]